MIEAIVCILLMLAYACGATWFAEQAEGLKTGISCRCGRHCVGVLVVDKVDGQRHADTLTEGCTRCRQEAAGKRQEARDKSGVTSYELRNSEEERSPAS